MIEEKLATFYKELDLGEFKPHSISHIANPGEKTKQSTFDKIKRNVEIFGKKDYTLQDVSDMSRCAVLLDSYEEVPIFLRSLKEQIPSLEGFISRFDSGYRGIHLNFEIDGINTEIQISTKEAWNVKEATELSYAKWRNFDQREEFANLFNLSKEIQTLLEDKELINDPQNLLKINEKQKE